MYSSEDSYEENFEIDNTIDQNKLVRACMRVKNGQMIIDNDRSDIEYHFVNFFKLDELFVRNLTDKQLCTLISNYYPNLYELKNPINNQLYIENLGEKDTEIYGNEDIRKKNSWIQKYPIQKESQYTKKLILFIKNALYNYYSLDFRNFTEEKASFLIRWIGYECNDFLHNLITGNIDKIQNTDCIARWRFIHKFWDATQMAFFLNYNDAKNIIQKNNNLYLIRLSTTYSGMMVIQFWDAKNKKVTAIRLDIDNFGNIIMGEYIARNIDELDKLFRTYYSIWYNILLPTIIDKQTAYKNLTHNYNYEYGY